MSMLKTNFIVTEYVGISNYLLSFKDPSFRQSLINSIFYTLILVPIDVIGSLLLALSASKLSKKWQDISRIIIYIPALAAGIIIAQIWQWVFHSDGPINWLLQQVGLHSINWFGQTVTAVPAIALIVAISHFGGNVIILLAAILSIDGSIFEAARIEGANSRQISRRIILPIIIPSIALVALLSAISAPQIFETIYALAPYEHAATVTYSIYAQGWQFSHWGMASAQSVILLVFVVGLTMIKKVAK
jgi:ABC-type sugar transport system permease subunit